ncbi:MAG: hypothetical protein M1819_005241 [Sarea resinae]|nr:MAG: hypothetical protein M1819_005241 [Sarea resinae]
MAYPNDPMLTQSRPLTWSEDQWQGHRISGHDNRVHNGHTFITKQGPLQELPCTPQASFGAAIRQHVPLCYSNTRSEVRNEIMRWAEGQDERCIFWLHGSAGAGKSTIARTIARKYYDQNRLGASFFFSRGTVDRSHTEKFFTTIAMQLASISSSLEERIRTVASKHTDISDRSLAEQWKLLILQPLSSLMADSCRSPLILVIDALDECENDKDVKMILQLLAESRLIGPIRLRIFVTSRPELPVRLGFCDMPGVWHLEYALDQISPTIVNNDISSFFIHRLHKVRETLEYPMPLSWPGDDKIKLLVEKAQGWFMYAATICAFIEKGSNQWPADDLLDLCILSKSKDGSSPRNAFDMMITDESPTRDLDEMYSQILKYSFRDVKTSQDTEQLAALFRHIIGTLVTAFKPLSAMSISKLLSVNVTTVHLRLRHLHSVLDVPDWAGDPVGVRHPSFREFLHSKQRCHDRRFWVDETKAHGNIADACIQLMSEHLGQDVCNLEAPGTLAGGAQGGPVADQLPPELRYACQYWVQHVELSSNDMSENAMLLDEGPVHQFLRKHLLHWLEALSFMRVTLEAAHAIASLKLMVATQDSPRLLAFIQDAQRFILYCRPIVEEAPLQTYSSALDLAPGNSLGVPSEWNAVLRTLDGHTLPIRGIAISCDNKLVVSASWDKTVRRWDLTTGTALNTLYGHTDSVPAVAVSGDGKVVASGSDDNNVRLWDAGTAGAQTLEGHTASVTVVAISHDRKLVVSASNGRTVRSSGDRERF